jgi:hypothetical protein
MDTIPSIQSNTIVLSGPAVSDKRLLGKEKKTVTTAN